MAKKMRNYTNGIITRRFAEDDIIPEGFVLGIKPLTEEQKRLKAEKTRLTNLAKYGVENPSQAESIKEKKKQTALKHYGVENPAMVKEVQERAKRTMLEKYGVEHISQSEEIKAKKRQTTFEHFGVEHPMQSKDVQEKSRQSVKERYGVEHISQSKEVQEKVRQTMLERYGVENAAQSPEIQEKIRRTNLKRYGVSSTNQIREVKEKKKESFLSHYGVEHPSQSKEIQDKKRETSLERYGTTHPMKSKFIQDKARKTTLKHYGVGHNFQSEEVKRGIRQTNIERYGVDWACQRPEARVGHSNSGPNKDFSEMLGEVGVQYSREFNLGSFSYDFKVGDTLIEIDPAVTHNVFWQPFGDHIPKITIDYHFKKSQVAEENGYRCIHIFDWEEKSKIIILLLPRETVYARKCKVVDVYLKDCDDFLNEHHLQNTCKGQVVRLGLYYRDRLVSLMTFGKPRYNKHYQWELLRYSSILNVTGGAERLFKHFIRSYNPESIISYCDRSKFPGKVYERLGFVLKTPGEPSCHWYNPRSNSRKHITDNFLRQRGFDQLFGTNFGKGASNKELMLNAGYLPVYDCGQAVYDWHREESV